jgi:hypothetical protein
VAAKGYRFVFGDLLQFDKIPEGEVHGLAAGAKVILGSILCLLIFLFC